MTRIPKLLPLLLSLPFCAQAQTLPQPAGIRTDGSTGAVTELRGPLMLIPETLGRQSGANLFHSFQRFHIDIGETARFTVQSAGIANVISRVTGGEPSLLNGNLELKAEQGAPAFFFINPAGVLFGGEARIDVAGGFHVSTAAELQMADGSRWSSAGGSSFSAAAPEAFGFVGGGRAAPIALLPGAVLAPPRQAPIQLVAGDLDFSAAQIAATGHVRLAATGDAAVAVPLGGDLPGALNGSLRLGEGSFVFVAALRDYAVGPIQASAGRIDLSGESAISTFTWDGSRGASGAVTLSGSERILLSEGSYVSTSTMTAAASGELRLQAPTIELTSGAYVQTLSEGVGTSGAITLLAAQDLILRDGTKVLSNSVASGDTGDVLLQAAHLWLDGKAQVITSSFGTGNAGALSLVGTEQLRLSNGAEIQSFGLNSGSTGLVSLRGGRVLLDPGAYVNSNADGEGNRTGDVLLQADHLLQLDGANVWTFGLNGATSSDVLLAAPDIRLLNRSGVLAGSLDARGRPGSIGLIASRTLELQGGSSVSSNTFSPFDGGTLLLEGQTIRIDEGSHITSTTYAAGNAGKIVLAAEGTLFIGGASAITSSADGGGQGVQGGLGGQIGLFGKDVWIGGQAMVYSSAGVGLSGRAGDVIVQATDTIRLDGKAFIDTSTYGDSAEAGNTLLQAGTLIDVRDASVLSNGYFGGRGGRILFMSDGAVDLGPSAVIATSTGSSGQAGDISFLAKSLRAQGAIVASRADPGASGNAGSISGLIGEWLDLAGTRISSGTSGSGSGGSVDLAASNLVLRGGSLIDAKAEAGSSGRTGYINLAATETLSLSEGSSVAINNEARVANPAVIEPKSIQLVAPRLRIEDAVVTAAATGNLAASSVALVGVEGLTLERARVTTSAQDGDGGALSLQTEGRLRLARSEVTTSVLGQQGNGGSIDVAAQILWLENGFVQANSNAQGGQGGLVNLAVGTVIASGNRITLGGPIALPFEQPRQAYNAIQAVAPDGVNGDIVLANPLQDLGGSLARLDARLLDTGQLGQSPCERRGGSSLALSGRGGLPQAAAAGSKPGLPGLQARVKGCP